ncbi:hypothetical protein RI129_007065 [Pyrocoelia pectoralis]|uniref:Uncharacterized protein n=1 Tax=Pyrocoelia pectoralis TaxID=417401 RepID=A0AAN7ZEL8_9COLE
MTNCNLSSSEKVLLSITVIVVFLSIILSLGIGFILPPNFINNDNDTSVQALKSYCMCSTTVRQRTAYQEQLNEKRSAPVKDDKVDLIAYNPYLVSLHTSAYIDEDTEQRFACSGHDCAANDEEWLNLVVRSGSAYWTKAGSLHAVKKYAYLEKNGPVLLQVSPPFNLGILRNTVKLSDGVTTWNNAVISNWIEPNWDKKSEYFVETWTKEQDLSSYDVKSGEIRQRVFCELQPVLTGALVSSESVLIAYRVGVCQDKHMFVDLQNGPYAKWLRHFITELKPRMLMQDLAKTSNFTPIYCSTFGRDPKTSFILMHPKVTSTTTLQVSNPSTSKTESDITLNDHTFEESNLRSEITSTSKPALNTESSLMMIT